jgi:hypothetical protein
MSAREAVDIPLAYFFADRLQWRGMSTLQAHEDTAVVGPDGSVRIADLPFGAGERVRVVVLADPVGKSRRHSPEEIALSRVIRHGLRGTVLRYDDPFGPAVPIEDWDALKDEQP